MVRYFIFLFITVSFLFSKEHFAKLEPFETVTIKSEVNGKVTFANDELEGKVVNGTIIKIDSFVDKQDLINSKESLRLTDAMIKLNKKMLPTLKKDMRKKRELYTNLLSVKSASVSQKNTLYANWVASVMQFNATKEKILNLENQKVSLLQKITQLQDRLKKKKIVVNGKYLYKLSVKKGEYVNIGTPLAIISDTNRAKLTIYLSEDELKNIENKKIYINGKKTNLKFYKIWKIADSKYISSYRAEIVLKPTYRFSKLLKVEIK